MLTKSFRNYGQWSTKSVAEYDDQQEFIIKDKEQLGAKFQRILDGEIDNLQVTTDFDQTITSFYNKKEKSLPTFSIFRLSELSDPTFRQNMTDLYNYYVPIEKNQTIKLEEKNKHLRDWYDKVSIEFTKAKFTIEKSLQILNDSKIALRYGFEEFFTYSQNVNLPFYIVSGGLDLICLTILESVLDLNSYKDFNFTANQLCIDQNLITELKMEVTATTKCEILASMGKEKFRRNNILLGDLPSDYYMTSSLELENQISFGFIDKKNAQHIDDHIKLFDITIAGDGSFIVPLYVLTTVNKQGLPEHLKKIWDESEQYNEVKECLQ